MHPDVRAIFTDAGATEEELTLLDAACRTTAQEVRDLIDAVAGSFRSEIAGPVRVLLVRVIHTDMERAFTRYKTENKG